MQDYQNVKNLTLDFSACELQIRTHEESFISLSASNTQDTFSCEQYGEDLILEDHREIFGDDAAAYPDQALRLTLLVPQETLDTLDISLDLGEIDAESLSADTVTVYCSLGSMEADSVSAGDLDLHFDLGDVDLDRLLCLCIGLEATLEETQRLLKLSAYAQLYPRSRRDAIIAYGILHHMELHAINDKLFSENEKTLS